MANHNDWRVGKVINAMRELYNSIDVEDTKRYVHINKNLSILIECERDQEGPIFDEHDNLVGDTTGQILNVAIYAVKKVGGEPFDGCTLGYPDYLTWEKRAREDIEYLLRCYGGDKK